MSGGCDQEAALLPLPSVHATLLMENSIITTNRLRKRVQPCTRCLEILMTIATVFCPVLLWQTGMKRQWQVPYSKSMSDSIQFGPFGP